MGYYPATGRNCSESIYWEPTSPYDDDSWAGFFCMRNTHSARQFVRKWLKFSENIDIIGREDSTFDKDKDRCLIAHQEDQAVLSLLIKKLNIRMYDMPPSFTGPLGPNQACRNCTSCHPKANYVPGCHRS